MTPPRPRKARPAEPDAESPLRQPRPTKISRLQQMLQAPKGASLVQLCEALGWQAHTLRAALTRLRQVGHAVERSRSKEGLTTYRIFAGAVDAAAAAGATTKPSTETAPESGEDEGANGGGAAGEMATSSAPSDLGGGLTVPDAGART